MGMKREFIIGRNGEKVPVLVPTTTISWEQFVKEAKPILEKMANAKKKPNNN